MPGHGDYRVDNLGRGLAASVEAAERTLDFWNQNYSQSASAGGASIEFSPTKTIITRGIIPGGKPPKSVPALPETPRLKRNPFSGISFRDRKFLRVGDKMHLQRHFDCDCSSYISTVVEVSTNFIKLSLHLNEILDIHKDKNIEKEILLDNNNFFDYSLHFCFDHKYLPQAQQLALQQASLIRMAFHNKKNRSEKKKQAKRMQLRSSCKQRRTPKQQGKTARLIKESFLEMNF